MKINLKMTREKTLKMLVGILALIVFVVAIIGVNSFKKEELISTKGQSYEKAKVIDITKDNIQEDGQRYGDQEVVLRI